MNGKKASSTWLFCQYNYQNSSRGLDNQVLRGFLPNDISQLRHLQNINLSGNSISGGIPTSLGSIPSLEIMDLNGNSLSGRVPAALGERLLHGASFNFTDNSGLCGIPGLPTCGPHLSVGTKIGIGLASLVAVLLIATCLTCWWKRRQNILRAQRIAGTAQEHVKVEMRF